MLAFILGVLLGALLMVCLSLEMLEEVRPLFSIVFLGGIIALFVAVFKAGMLFTPMFIFGMLVNVLFIFVPIGLLGGEKDGGKR